MTAEPLSRRQVEVITLFADGCTRRQVAEILGISPETVKTYIERAFEKLDVHTMPEAVIACVRVGLVA